MSKRKIAIIAGVAIIATVAVGAVAFGARDRDGGDDMMEGRGGRHGMHGGEWGGGRGHGRGHEGGHGGGWRERFGMDRSMTKEDFATRTRERFARLDKNSDGVIERSEIEAMQAANMERRGRRAEKGADRMLRRLGADADGKVTKQAFLDRVKTGFARLDLDSDGKITDADLPPMMRGRGVLSGAGAEARMGQRGHHGMRRGGGGQRPLMGMVREAAVNGAASLDGVLAVAEKRYQRIDRNGDGVVDKADGEALRKEMAAYRVDRFMHNFGARQSGRITREQFDKVAAERFAMRDTDGDGVIGRGDGRRGHGRGHGEGGMGRGEGRGMGRGMGSGSANDPASGEAPAPRRN